jgi:hypothetical protein
MQPHRKFVAAFDDDSADDEPMNANNIEMIASVLLCS